MTEPIRSPPPSGVRVDRASAEFRRHHVRRDSNISTASFYSDVEMAQHEVFSGPVPESLPSSISSFAHRRRSRTGSIASFQFFQEMNIEQQQWPQQDHEQALADEEEEGEYRYEPSEVDLEVGTFESSSIRRKASQLHRDSVEDPLLQQRESTKSDGYRGARRMTQKIYIVTEDLTIVVAGYTTSRVGSLLMIILSVMTFGMGYLILKWVPRWRIGIIGKPTPLANCDWMVVENQWGELSIHEVCKHRYGQSLSTVFGASPVVPASYDMDEDDDPVIPYLRHLDYRYIRFSYHPILDKFAMNNSWRDPSWTSVKELRRGVEGEDKEFRSLVFGKNVIDIEEKTVMQLLIDEAFHPFYVFQIASLILWSLDEYYYYAVCIFIISAVSIVSTLVETKTTMRRLREVSRFVCDVRVLRSGFWSYVSSEDLVPGDVFEVTDPSLSQFPCDSLLLSGDCIVNESMLTGESIPVSKAPCTNEALENINLGASTVLPDHAKYFLFAGTKIVRARKPQGEGDMGDVGLAMVVRTGFNTTKGALVRSMLFPKPSGFKFYRDSFYYIGVMAGIAACGFVASFINFIRLGLPWHMIFVRALDLITIVVPPALPATLTIGTNFALSRLKTKKIYCISPQRVNVGGKLDIVCFDKTGTLTEDGLDVLGVRVVEENSHKFGELLSNTQAVQNTGRTSDSNLPRAVFNTMTTCHSLRLVDDELVGDPLDQKMFEFTGWIYSEGEQTQARQENVGRDGQEAQQSKFSPPIVRPPPSQRALRDMGINNESSDQQPVELGIMKSFEFVSQLRRTSVIVKQFKAQGANIYVKGAPECMPDICVPESFPEDYHEILAHYTHRGYRVIACATKHIYKLSWVRAQKMKRTDAESGLIFAGFIIFENKLKPQTAGALRELARAEIRQVMCTGDNILTAISVARECNLISETAHVFVPHFAEGDMLSPHARLHWESVNDPGIMLDEDTLRPLEPPADGNPYGISDLKNYSLAVSGDVFRWIIDFAPLEVLHRMLICGQVFARMSPDEKHELVEKLQSIDYTVGFCGDGANDCGALKAADVGISLSEAEASVAAPFTSRVFDISCVPRVIREGRASLVTSFSCFKYMSLYSAIQFTTVSILYRRASNLGDFQFLFIDLFLILPIAVFMGWSGPFPTLCPKRPTASLVSRKVLTPLLGQIFLTFILQLLVLKAVQSQPWYITPKIGVDKSQIANSENTALFLASSYQYILAAVVLNVGPPYREKMSRNVPFVGTVAAALGVSTWLVVYPGGWATEVMQLTWMSRDFKVLLLGLGVIFVSSVSISWYMV